MTTEQESPMPARGAGRDVTAAEEVRALCERLVQQGGGRLAVPASAVEQVRVAHVELGSGISFKRRLCRCGGVCRVLAAYWAHEAADGSTISVPRCTPRAALPPAAGGDDAHE